MPQQVSSQQQESLQQFPNQMSNQQQFQQQVTQQQALGFSINVDNSALVVNAVQNQLQSNVSMLAKPEVAEVKMGVGIKIDNMIGLSGVKSFPEYTVY